MYWVIMAGGKGTRFWPRSRMALPKQLLDIVSEKTMLQETISRILPCCQPEKILIITNAQQEELVRSQAPMVPSENIIAEPVGKNTAPCIAVAAAWILGHGIDDVMVVVPADHFIKDGDSFRACIKLAVDAATLHDVLITIGIAPRSPETGYGYIQQGNRSLPGFDDVIRVECFHEKPDRATAEAFLRQGNFFWNSGIFVWKASVIMQELAEHLPDLYHAVVPLQNCRAQEEFVRLVMEVYQKVRAISIDYGVMEKARQVYVIRGDFGWSDIGSWSAIYDIADRDIHGNVIRGEVVAHDTCDSLIFSEKRLVAVSGLRDVIVVETGDAVLVCSKKNAQEIRHIVEVLEREGKTEYL